MPKPFPFSSPCQGPAFKYVWYIHTCNLVKLDLYVYAFKLKSRLKEKKNTSVMDAEEVTKLIRLGLIEAFKPVEMLFY